jgi:membrane protease YdiL (CAAX protease family)
MKDRKLHVAVGAAVVLLLAAELAGRLYQSESVLFPMAETVLTRLIGALVFVLLIRRMGYRVFRRAGRNSADAVWIPVLAALVALNNFPVIGIFSGNARITAGPGVIALFAAECAAVGCFEELAFRGFLLPYCAEALKGKARAALPAAFVSSAVFGLVHLVNLFSGVSPGAVLMQIGYSFLIGGMCACVLLATGNVWICAGIHAVYNFCGTILSRYGEGIRWDTVTVAETAVVGVIVSAVMVMYLLKSDSALLLLLPENEK